MLSGEECEFYVDSVACDIDCKIALSYDCVQGKGSYSLLSSPFLELSSYGLEIPNGAHNEIVYFIGANTTFSEDSDWLLNSQSRVGLIASSLVDN